MVKPRGKMGKMKKHVTVRKLGEKERASDNFELLCFVISESETERLQQGFFFVLINIHVFFLQHQFIIQYDSKNEKVKKKYYH